MEEERPNRWKRFKRVVLENLLTIMLVSSVISGCVIGVIIRSNTKPLDESSSAYLKFPGDLLIRMLKCAATPLILGCIIVALGSLDLKVSKRIFWQLMILVFGTKVLSSLVGLAAVLLIQPGNISTEESQPQKWDNEQGTILDIFLDMFRNIITANMVRMYVQQCKTKLFPPEENNTIVDPIQWSAENLYIDNMNMLGIIFVAILVGLCLAILQEEGKALYYFAGTVYSVSMKVATWILWLSPWLIFFLIISEILKIKDFYIFAEIWGKFLLTTYSGYAFIFLVEYPLLVFLFTRENPYKLLVDVGTALITAYATSSSLATMPLLIDGLLQHGLDSRLVRFVVPIGVNINKDGSASFLVSATIFVAQIVDVPLTWGHYITILVLASMGSIAAAAVPFSAIVVLVMILNGLGLSQSWIGGILAIEWINDRGATVCNIFGNSCQPKILCKWNSKHLEDVDKKM